MFRRNKKENKAKLEHKLYLARENPEPLFDLSECGISNVPSGVYSLCRVFLKESLNLSHNFLTTLSGGGNLKDLHLLKVLDLSDNTFSSIPEDIYLLKNLLELHLKNNQIKKLPLTLCNLEQLRVLDVSNNHLRSLPDNIGSLVRLQILNVTINKELKHLPKSICKAQRITSLNLDSNNFVYPPAEIAQRGIDSIMKYICDDTGFNYVPPSDIVDSSTTSDIPSSLPEEDHLQAKIWKLEKIKEQKLQEFLEIERNNELLQRQELEIANAHKINRKKLLEDITQQQNKFDQDLAKIQQERDIDRFRLIEQLQTTEQNADLAIKQLLALNAEPLAQLLEQEQEEERRLIAAANKYNENLRKDDILYAMQELLDQETKKFKQFDVDRAETAKFALEQEMLCDTMIAEILKNKDLEQFELLSQLQEDSQLQKFAVGALLERGDARSWGLVQQVRLVETQLAALTNIEMDRRKLEVSDQLNDLSEKRINLSILLMDLLEQQNTRRAQLLSTLQSLEDYAVSGEDFWLKQYQRLLDRLPSGLSEAQNNINPGLAQALLMAGVIHCLPFIAKWAQVECELLGVTEDDLRSAGVNNSDDRKRILDAFRIYKKTCEEYPSSAAAPSIDEAASAPLPDPNSTYSTSECVICMDQNCQVIFVPCGHYCCCTNCSAPLVECPLCRGTIDRKIRVVSA